MRPFPPGAEVHLKVKNISVMFGQVRAVQGVTLEARPREVVAVFVAAGSGKTTLLKAASGTVRAPSRRRNPPAAGGSPLCGRAPVAGPRARDDGNPLAPPVRRTVPRTRPRGAGQDSLGHRRGTAREGDHPSGRTRRGGGVPRPRPVLRLPERENDPRGGAKLRHLRGMPARDVPPVLPAGSRGRFQGRGPMSEPGGRGEGVRGREQVIVTLPADLCEKLSDFCREWKVSPALVVERGPAEYLRRGGMSHRP